VDFSPLSSAALQLAAEIASKTGGHLTALSVEDPLLGQGAAAVGYDTALLRKSTLQNLQRLMQRVVAPAGLAPDRWSVDSALGHPAPTIVTSAKRLNSDLIVMGTNSRRGAGKLFFGSVAEGVLRRAPIPVVVVPRRPSRQDRRMLAKGLVGAIELGGHDRSDARRISRVAEVLGLPLTLLHVVARTPVPPWLADRLEDLERRRLVAARVRVDALAKSVGARGQVVIGRPAEEIPAAALTMKSSLVALVLRRGRGLFGARQGSITYHVLGGSAVPVMALPPA
jgi:nucleotide-binding universal stress UspA family protein